MMKYAERFPHLVEKTRVRLACDYIGHEFRKVFPVTLTQQDVCKAIHGPDTDSGDVEIRDFWNLFCAMSSTWRLKDIYEKVADENVNWKEASLPIDKLYPETMQGWMKMVGGSYDFAKFSFFLKKDENARSKAIKELLKYKECHGSGSESDRIIVMKENGCNKVIDGNGRLTNRIAQWVIEGSNQPYPEMKIWLGEGSGEPNYWVPTSSLFYLHNMKNQTDIEPVLRKLTLVAREEYQRRVAQSMPKSEE